MKIPKCLFIFILLGSTSRANEFGELPEVSALTRGRPQDVVALIERIAECHHYGGEEPYDKERAQQIAKAAKQAACQRIDSDTKVIKKKYVKDKKVLGAIEKAENLAL